MQRDINKPLYLITDGEKLRTSGLLLSSIEQALHGAKGAVKYIQLREQVITTKSPASDKDVINLGHQLLPLCHRYGAHLIINRRVDLALAIGANGVHLGSRCIRIQDARTLLGKEAVIGYSAHSYQEALSATTNGASYVTLAPVFAPLSKKPTHTALGIETLALVSNEINIPVFALGGITASNTAACKNAGASGIALITSVLLSDDPEAAAREIESSWNAAI